MLHRAKGSVLAAGAEATFAIEATSGEVEGRVQESILLERGLGQNVC